MVLECNLYICKKQHEVRACVLQCRYLPAEAEHPRRVCQGVYSGEYVGGWKAIIFFARGIMLSTPTDLLFIKKRKEVKQVQK